MLNFIPENVCQNLLKHLLLRQSKQPTMNRIFLILLLFLFSSIYINAQQVTLTPDQIKALTPEWKGERFPDGRPKVSDRILERLKNVALEEAWGYFVIKVIKINLKVIG